jgi:hypothetical protein
VEGGPAFWHAGTTARGTPRAGKEPRQWILPRAQVSLRLARLGLVGWVRLDRFPEQRGTPGAGEPHESRGRSDGACRLAGWTSTGYPSVVTVGAGSFTVIPLRVEWITIGDVGWEVA